MCIRDSPTTDAVFQTMEIDDPRHFGCLTVGPDGFIDHLSLIHI